jgi:hypothetical protein
VVRLCDPARDGGARPFRDLGRWPVDKLGGRAFDALMALIEVSGAVVGKDALQRLVASESGYVKVRTGASTNARPVRTFGLSCHQALGGIPRRVTASESLMARFLIKIAGSGRAKLHNYTTR